MLLRKLTGLQAILFVSLSLAAFRSVPAQVLDLDKERVRLTEVHALWRFHIGDDPTWAKSDFNDSGWSLLTMDEGWPEQGYKGYVGVAWYRIQVVLPTKHAAMALFVPNV